MSILSPSVFEILALLPAKPEFGDAVSYIFLGILIVMIVLGLMWFGTWSVGLIFKSIDQRQTSKGSTQEEQRRKVVATAAAIAVVQRESGAAPSNPSGEEYNRLVAVIAAAAQMAVGRPARVVSIKRSSGEWSAEGRRQIFDSRRVR